MSTEHPASEGQPLNPTPSLDMGNPAPTSFNKDDSATINSSNPRQEEGSPVPTIEKSTTAASQHKSPTTTSISVAPEEETNTEMELAPLPTEFDPNAPPPPIPQVTSEEDQSTSNPFGVQEHEDEEDDLHSITEHQEGEGEEEDEGKIMDYITSLQQFNVPEEEEEEEEEEVEQVENRDTVPPISKEPELPTVVEEQAQIIGEEVPEVVDEQAKDAGDEQPKEQDQEGTKDVKMQTRASSPLTPVSDLPDLPDTLTFSPTAPTNPLPPVPTTNYKKRKEKPTESLEPSIPHAESSKSAQKRSIASPSIAAPVLKRPIAPPVISGPILKRSAPQSTTTPKMPLKAGTKRSRLDDSTKHSQDKVKGKRKGGPPKDKGKVIDLTEVDEIEEDDLNSISDKDSLREIDPEELESIEVTQPERAHENELGSDTGSKKKNKRSKSVVENEKPTKLLRSKRRLDATSGIKVSEKPPENIAPRAKVYSDAVIKKMFEGKTKELQLAPCLRPRYGKWGKCTQCIAKLGGDSCRFREFRTFPINPETTEITGPGWFESTEWKEETTPLPTDFNKDFEEEEIVKTEKTVAPMLLPLITSEARHVFAKKSIKRGMDAAKHRSVCDFCSSTIFGGWFFCKTCGRDYCLACERYFPDSLETITQSPWPMPDAARPRLLRCQHVTIEGQGKQHKPRGTAMHSRANLQAVSRFDSEELKEHWLKLSEFVLNDEKIDFETKLSYMCLKKEDYQDEEDIRKNDGNGKDDVNDNEQAEKEVIDSIIPLPNDEKELEENLNPDLNDPGQDILDRDEDKDAFNLYKYTKITNPQVAKIPDPAELEEESREFLFVNNENLTNDLFDKIWSKGEPIIADNVNEGLHLGWTPNDFIDRFGYEQCYVVNCQTDVSQPTTVGEFFDEFKDPENRKQDILKLKDWPATDDFKNTHPELYNDFCDALPVPDYTRREGVMNLYAHFPPGPTKPDIGPKMYNAFEARESTGGFGSTRLHMDVADAVNLLLYASPRRRHKGTPKPKVREDKVNGDTYKNTNDRQDSEQNTAPGTDKNQEQGKVDVSIVETVNTLNDVLPENQHKDDQQEKSTDQNGNSIVDKEGESENQRTKHQNFDKAQSEMQVQSDKGDQVEDGSAEEQEREAEAEDDEEEEQPGCAVWDLFRAEDADLIREFLKEKFGHVFIFTDPIHSQLFYLDSKLRSELFETKGVRGWRVYQYPGQAVFIPAGCAHQVCNLADCIKIALDFVSPHNVRRCQQLTADFRKENFAKAWKQDVLQLYNVLWYAWLSCIETRKRRIREDEETALAQKAREEHLASLRKGQHEPYDASLNHRRQHSRLGSPLSSSRNQGWTGGGWNVSSVRDEPPLDSRSPSISRGGSPILSRGVGEDIDMEDAAKDRDKGSEGAEKEKQAEKLETNQEKDADKDGIETVIRTRTQKELAEKLFSITLEKEPPSSSETFLGSNTLWSGRKGITLPKTKSSPSFNTNTRTLRGGESDWQDGIKSETTTPTVLSARQMSLLAKQKEAEEKKEKERLERRLKNPPRELRESTLIKLGAKKFEDFWEIAKSDMVGETPLISNGDDGAGIIIGGSNGEEIWPNPNPNPTTTSSNTNSNAGSNVNSTLHNYEFLSDINELRNTQDNHNHNHGNDSPMTVDLHLDPEFNTEMRDQLRSLLRNQGEDIDEEGEGDNGYDNMIEHTHEDQGQGEDQQDEHIGMDEDDTEESRRERAELAANLRLVGEIEMDDLEVDGHDGENSEVGGELFEM